MFGLPLLYFFHLDRVLSWIHSVTRFYNIVFAVGDVVALILFIMLVIGLIGRGLS